MNGAAGERGIEIHQVYGLTESCGPACLIGSEDAIVRAGSTGKAFFHTDVRVVDDTNNEILFQPPLAADLWQQKMMSPAAQKTPCTQLWFELR